MTELEKINKFFKLDLKIKKKMVEISPSNTNDIIEINDTIYNGLKDIEDNLTTMAELNNSEETTKSIKHFMDKVIDKFTNLTISEKNIKDFYEKNISNMSVELENKIKTNFIVDYANKKDPSFFLKECQTVNEALHIMHQYALNDENLYQKLNKIDYKYIEPPTEQYSETVDLYGVETVPARKIFEKLPKILHEKKSEHADILSLDNKIIIIARGIEHATSLEIDLSDENLAVVNYFIPKVHNYNIISEIPRKMNEQGINTVSNQVNKELSVASGFFQVPKDKLPEAVAGKNGIFSMVTTDDDLFLNTRNELEEMVNEFNEESLEYNKTI